MLKYTVIGAGLFAVALSAQATEHEGFCQVYADFAEGTAKKRDSGESKYEQRSRVVEVLGESSYVDSPSEEKLLKEKLLEVIKVAYMYEDMPPEELRYMAKAECEDAFKEAFSSS